MLHRQQRQRELKMWAKKDYGIDQPDLHAVSSISSMGRTIQTSPRTHTTAAVQLPHYVSIEDEVDFIFKVRNKYIQKVNFQNAVKIQSWLRMKFARRNYLIYRDKVVGAVRFIQQFMKMYWFKQVFMKNLKVTKEVSSKLIQRYLRGFTVHKMYKEVVHRNKIDALMTHFRAVRH